METWMYFLIGWGIFLVGVYGHLIFDYKRYYSNMPDRWRRIYRAFTEE